MHPEIDNNKCNNCGLCYKACPLNSYENKNTYPIATYAMQNNNLQVLEKSSSGGAFYALAEKTINNGGVVYGCAFQNRKAVHKRADSISDLLSLLGSKYVQSDVRCFRDVKKDLLSEIPVLFSGTPCQVAGLKSFLKKDYPNLICVDFICHGVPSPKVLDLYLDACEKQYNAPVTHVEFRNKRFGWSKFAMRLVNNDTEILCESRKTNLYLKTFLTNTSIRTSCGKCRFNTLPRQADITLGDFWGANIEIEDIEKGLSVLAVNSDNGLKIFNDIKDDFKVYPITLEDIKRGNPFINGHCTLAKKRDLFFKHIDNKEITQNMNECIIPTISEYIKGIITYKIKTIFKKR